jgi:protein-S-isoprenylcysteine O-methyltransferase Ste14
MCPASHAICPSESEWLNMAGSSTNTFWGLIPFSLYVPVTVIRILNEEKVLSEGLDGYTEYTKKVKYRLLPFIW